jgi:hypothetical protein
VTFLQFLQSFCNPFTSPLQFPNYRTGPTNYNASAQQPTKLR